MPKNVTPLVKEILRKLESSIVDTMGLDLKKEIPFRFVKQILSFS